MNEKRVHINIIILIMCVKPMLFPLWKLLAFLCNSWNFVSVVLVWIAHAVATQKFIAYKKPSVLLKGHILLQMHTLVSEMG